MRKIVLITVFSFLSNSAFASLIGSVKSTPFPMIPAKLVSVYGEINTLKDSALQSSSENVKLEAISLIAPALADLPGCQFVAIEAIKQIAYSGGEGVRQHAAFVIEVSLDADFNQSFFPPVQMAQTLKKAALAELN